jgi:glutamyl-tRNA reductase
MHIHCLGLNHQTAQVGLRERIAFGEDETKAALARLGSGSGSQPETLTEMVILSTCNRVELYAVSPALDQQVLLDYLVDVHSIPLGEYAPYLYHFVDQAAVHHLLRVSAGLDSLVLGEPQILGQVTGSIELAQGQDSSGPLLTRLFQIAIHAGKRARSETQISRNPASISSLAASLAERSLPNLEQAQVVILGAGEMAELAVEALRKRGVAHILVVNRTLAHATELAERWGAQVTTFERLEEALASADILIASTGAPHMVIYPPFMEKVMQARQERLLVAIDIAVPRDIDPGVGYLPGIQLYNLDSLSQHLEVSLAEREHEVPCVEAILAEEESRFMEFFNALDILPLIAQLRDQAESIRQSELNKTLRRLPELSEAEKARVDALTRALVKRLINGPITRLRAEAQYPNASEIAALVLELYGLESRDPSYRTSAGPSLLAAGSDYPA